MLGELKRRYVERQLRMFRRLRESRDRVLADTLRAGGSGAPHPADGRAAEGCRRAAGLWRLVNDNDDGCQVYQQRAGQRTIRSCCPDQRDGETSSGLRALLMAVAGLFYARGRSSEHFGD